MKHTYILFLFILIACNTITIKEEDNRLRTIDIDKVSKIKQHKINIKKVIPLETGKNSLIAYISEIIIKNNKIYILDIKLNCIFIFDLNGNFLNKVSNKGRGPGEYISIKSFDVNEKGDIFISSTLQRKIIIYKNGQIKNFKEVSVNKEMPFIFFKILNNKTLYSCWVYEKDKLKYQIAKYDLNTQKFTPLPIETCDYFDINKSVFTSNIILNTSDSIITYYSRLTDKIYEFTNKGLNGYTQIKGLNYPDEEFFKNNLLRRGMKYSLSIDDIYQTSKYYKFLYFESDNFNYIVYNKKNFKAYSSINTGFNNHLFFNTKGTYNDMFVTSCSSMDIERFDIKHEILNNAINTFNINEESNPMLILYDFNY